MNVESLREYCLSLPLATEDFPFDETTLVFRVVGKIFAMLDLERPDVVSLKCNPDYALQLREEHPEISGAWHMNKKYWISVYFEQDVPDSLIRELVKASYDLVAGSLTKKARDALDSL